MKRRVDRRVPVLLVLAPSLLLAACGDEMPVASEEPPVQASVSVAAPDPVAVHQATDELGTFTRVLDDPFVHLLIGSLHNTGAADAIRASVTAASRELSAYEPVSARLAFASARSEIEAYADDPEADANDVVTLAALRLIFERGPDEQPRRKVEQ